MAKFIETIGRETFIDVPLYKRKNKLKLLYINPGLYERLFGKYSFTKAKNFLETEFSVTINDEYRLNDEVIDIAHVDYQGDPSGIALDGNKGSGRAYYKSDNFNIKGELTPLATSPHPVYNNGKLSLESAIHETLISNVLAPEFGTYETLAILDPCEEYLFPGSSEPMRCALMIRVHKDNELYRFSHRFINGVPFTSPELYAVAEKMGKLEGKKFIHRLLHGAWSLGNLSVDVNMIDFDTTYFTKNRNPAFSFTYKYKTNYFGEEYLGQEKILELILNSELNIDHVTLEELGIIIECVMNKEIVSLFPQLMGLNEINEEIDSLVERFIRLSKYFYKNYDELYTMSPGNDDIALFNFSRLFRYYPGLVRDGKYSVQECLKLLLNSDGELNETDNTEIMVKIDEYFSEYQVDSDYNFMALVDEAIQFIKDYNDLFRRNMGDLNKAVINAYIVNEDRTYLFNNRLSKYHLAAISDRKKVNRLMNLIISASSRDLEKREYICDLHIAEDNCSYTVIKENEFYYEEINFAGDILNRSESYPIEEVGKERRR